MRWTCVRRCFGPEGRLRTCVSYLGASSRPCVLMRRPSGCGPRAAGAGGLPDLHAGDDGAAACEQPAAQCMAAAGHWTWFQHVAADSYFILHATKPDPSSDELGRMTSTAGAPRRCCLPSHVLHCKPARRRELHFVSTSGSSCVPKLADTWQLLGAFSLPEFQCAAHCRWGRPGPSGRLKVHGQPGRGHAVRDPLCAAGAAGGAPPPHPPPLAPERRPRRAAPPARA